MAKLAPDITIHTAPRAGAGTLEKAAARERKAGMGANYACRGENASFPAAGLGCTGCMATAYCRDCRTIRWQGRGAVQFVVIAYDGTDAGALDRRLAARPAHLENARRMREEGALLTGGAILDDQGAMIGSVLVVDFPSRTGLDAWLASDPYVTGDVWRKVEARPFRVAV